MKVLNVQKQSESQSHSVQSNDKYLYKERENFVKGFIGTNKTGKTAVTREIAIGWSEDKDDGYTILGFDPRRQLQDICDSFIYITDSDEEIVSKINDTRNALLILDDYRILHDEDKVRPWLLYLLQQKDGYNIDIIYSCHNPELVINKLTYFTTHYYIFYTNVQEGGWKRKIPNYTLCMSGSSYVNKYVRKYGRGEYPNFPYMYIDTENEKLCAINMNKPL